jgi:hypothetical protein
MDALGRLRPVGDAYATMPVAEAFTWRDASAELGVGEWYLVAFRSVRRASADEAKLTLFDELAHQEAAASPGFVHYFKGPRAEDGSCLSFCLWQTRADARAAAGRPAHVQAVSLLDEMYESYTLEFQRVTRTGDGPLAFEPYDQPGLPQHVHVTGADLHPVRRPVDPTVEGPIPSLPAKPAVAF